MRLGGSAVGLALAAVGGAAGVAALGIGTGWAAGSWGPRAVPLLAAGTLMMAGVADARSARGVPAAAPDDGGRPWQVPLLLALAIGYVLLIDRTGYLFATALAAPLAFMLFGLRSPFKLLAVALVVPLLLHMVFFRLLAVFPPFGSWFDLTDILPV